MSGPPPSSFSCRRPLFSTAPSLLVSPPTPTSAHGGARRPKSREERGAGPRAPPPLRLAARSSARQLPARGGSSRAGAAAGASGASRGHLLAATAVCPPRPRTRPEQGLPVERSEAGERSRMRRRGVGCRGAERCGAAAEGAPARNEEERPPWPARKRRSGGRRGKRRRGAAAAGEEGGGGGDAPLLPPLRRRPSPAPTVGGQRRAHAGSPRQGQPPTPASSRGRSRARAGWPPTPDTGMRGPPLLPRCGGRARHRVPVAMGGATLSCSLGQWPARWPWRVLGGGSSGADVGACRAWGGAGTKQRGVAAEQGPRGRRRTSAHQPPPRPGRGAPPSAAVASSSRGGDLGGPGVRRGSAAAGGRAANHLPGGRGRRGHGNGAVERRGGRGTRAVEPWSDEAAAATSVLAASSVRRARRLNSPTSRSSLPFTKVAPPRGQILPPWRSRSPAATCASPRSPRPVAARSPTRVRRPLSAVPCAAAPPRDLARP